MAGIISVSVAPGNASIQNPNPPCAPVPPWLIPSGGSLGITLDIFFLSSAHAVPKAPCYFPDVPWMLLSVSQPRPL